MKIGIDAGALAIDDERLKVGVYQVTRHFIQEIAKIDTKNEYRLYSFRSIDKNNIPDTKHIRNIIVGPAKAWMHVALPIELLVHPVDVFLGLSQSIPRNITNAIGFIYDLAFIHTPELYPKSYARLCKQTENLIEKSSKIITISKASAEDIKKQFPQYKKEIIIAYPGIDSVFNEDKVGIQSKIPYFVFVGSLKKSKNIPHLIRAFHEFIRKENKHHNLYLIGGDYWPDPGIQETIDALNMQERVTLLGYIPDEQLAQYYRGAIAFITAALWEGFCLPAAEAMASACPVICFNSGAVSEIVGDAGLIVPIKEKDGLTNAMTTMIHDADKRRGLITKGLQKSKQYTWKNFTHIVLNTYSK